MTLTKEQHTTLRAMADGSPFTLWPMMRRALLRAGYIEPDGPVPPPAETRHPKRPVRQYSVTAAGREALASYTGPEASPHHEQYPRILF